MPLLLVLALALFLLYLFIPIALAMKETKPLMDAAVPYVQEPENPDRRILVIGDSTAVGTGGAPEESIAGRLGVRYPNATIVNDSENGMRLEAFVQRITAREEERYDLIVMQIGANDIVMLTSERKMRERLRESLAIATDMSPEVIVLSAGNVGLAPVFRWPLSALYTERARSARTLYQEEIAAYPEATYIDLFNEREDEPFNTDIDRYYASDHFHPSGDGYGIWYMKVEAALES